MAHFPREFLVPTYQHTFAYGQKQAAVSRMKLQFIYRLSVTCVML